MSTHRLSFLFMTSLACLSGAVQAQGPWPSRSQPTFFSPVQEFFTSRSYTSNDHSPMYSQNPSTPIQPGVPQSANGRSRLSCPNGQCSNSNRCANGQCLTPTQSLYQPGGYGDSTSHTGAGNCTHGQCRPQTSCPNGQCGPGTGSDGRYGTLRPSLQNPSIGLRPLTPNYTAPRSGNLNRLIPLDGGSPVNDGDNVPQGPMYRDQESMVPRGDDYRYAPGVRLQ